jgi:hypothetical protein
MPKLQNAVMNHIHTCIRTNTTDGQFAEFAHIAYNHGGGEHALGKFARWALIWCSDEALVYRADNLPNKLVLQVMMMFKKFQSKENRVVFVAETFHVAVDEH